MPTFKYRSIVAVVLLSIFTCGIYPIYYTIVTQDAVRQNYTREVLPSGLTVVLLSIITCGIYSIYWMCKTAVAINNIALDKELQNSDDTVLMVILGVFLTPIIYYAILQSKINLIVSAQGNNEAIQ